MQTAKLNIYSPKNPEDSAVIIGDTRGLLTLRRMIDEALDSEINTSRKELYTMRSESCQIIVAHAQQGLDGKIVDPFTQPEYSIEGMKCKEALAEIMLGPSLV